MPQLPIERQIEIVSEAGYRGIELVSRHGGAIDALTIDSAERRRVRCLLSEAGLTLTAIAGHADLLEPDDDARGANELRLRAGLDLAADLGAPALVAMGYGAPERYEAERETLAERCATLAKHAERAGVILALEPHGGQMIDSPEKCIWLIDRIGSPFFRLNFDNSHFETMGRDINDYVPRLVPYSVHTHLKDQRGSYPDHEFLVPGEGSFDYARYLVAMATVGYSGWITIEISVMVQRRGDYDPAEVAARSFRVLSEAAGRA